MGGRAFSGLRVASLTQRSAATHRSFGLAEPPKILRPFLHACFRSALRSHQKSSAHYCVKALVQHELCSMHCPGFHGTTEAMQHRIEEGSHHASHCIPTGGRCDAVKPFWLTISVEPPVRGSHALLVRLFAIRRLVCLRLTACCPGPGAVRPGS